MTDQRPDKAHVRTKSHKEDDAADDGDEHQDATTSTPPGRWGEADTHKSIRTPTARPNRTTPTTTQKDDANDDSDKEQNTRINNHSQTATDLTTQIQLTATGP